jgi:hypothetical protein
MSTILKHKFTNCKIFNLAKMPLFSKLFSRFFGENFLGFRNVRPIFTYHARTHNRECTTCVSDGDVRQIRELKKMRHGKMFKNARNLEKTHTSF